MERADLVRLLREYLAVEMSLPPETVAQMGDDLAMLLPFSSAAAGGRWPSARELDQLVSSCDGLEMYLAGADVWRVIAETEAARAFGRPRSYLVEPQSFPTNMTYDTGHGLRSELE